MTDPLQFPSTTPRLKLPLLFAGQAQKEFFVNAAFSRCDALIHPVVEDEIATPPANPDEDGCWLVANEATGAFAGKEGNLAFPMAGDWEFLVPREGMRVYDKAAGQFLLHFAGDWHREAGIAAPDGGQIVDTEARNAIEQLIAIMSRSGILPGF